MSRLLLRQDLMAFASIVFWPDSIPSRRHYTIRIQSILQTLVEPHQRLKSAILYPSRGKYMIVPIIRRGNLILQHKMSSILSISHCFGLGNQLPHARQCIFLAHRIPLVEDNHGNVMHFPPANAECRQYIEAVFRTDALTESKLSRSIFAADR